MPVRLPVLAHLRFQQVKGQFEGLPSSDIFAKIHQTNLWGSPASSSGIGSELDSTARLRELLPPFLKDLGVRTLLDIPCGDFHWLSQVNLPVESYVGADIVQAVVDRNRQAYPDRHFVRLDLCADPLPKADLVFCRDCLVHLSNKEIHQAIANLKASGSRWLLTTHFLDCTENIDIATGDWRMLNFQLPPFNWPAPERSLVEDCRESDGCYSDKVLGLWLTQSI